MSDWLHDLPVAWMAAAVFGFTYLLAGAVFAIVRTLATGERARSFKAISPSTLPVIGMIFGLFVAFTAVQVWNDSDRAGTAVSREASALRDAMLLAAGLPDEQQAHLHGLLREYVQHAATTEWPEMAKRTASLRTVPPGLASALQFVAAIAPQDAGQQTAQREIVSSLRTALDARRERIILSRAAVNSVKWLCLYLQATCELFMIGFVHSDNRLAACIAMGLFATGVAASVLLIAAHDRPFTGYISISPEPLLQIMPDAPAVR